MIKVCFFDMDGTLVSHKDGKIPQSTRKALHLLQKNNIQIVLATGRHILELEEMDGSDISFDGYILLNGNLCLNKEKKIISSNPISKEDTKVLQSLFDEKKFPVMFVEEDKFYNNFNNEYVEMAQKAISSPLPEIDTYTNKDIYQAIAYVEDASFLKELLKNCSITRWNRYGVDINALKGGKAQGIKSYIDANNISKEEIMAFGDADNDKEMLKYAHIGIAMGNADEETKQYADYVTTHIDEDGIYNALKHFKLI